MRRALLDTNVLVSAFLFYERGGVPVALIRKAAEGRFTLVTCRALLDELEGVLVRDVAVQERYGYPHIPTHHQCGHSGGGGSCPWDYGGQRPIIHRCAAGVGR